MKKINSIIVPLSLTKEVVVTTSIANVCIGMILCTIVAGYSFYKAYKTFRGE